MSKVGSIHFFLEFLNLNSNSLSLKKQNLNSLTFKKVNSNSLTLKKLNSNSNSLTLQKSNSNSISSITRERIQIQIQSNPTFYTKDSKRILQFPPSKSQMCISASQVRNKQQLKSLESRIRYSGLATANEVREHQPKVGGH